MTLFTLKTHFPPAVFLRILEEQTTSFKRFGTYINRTSLVSSKINGNSFVLASNFDPCSKRLIATIVATEKGSEIQCYWKLDLWQNIMSFGSDPDFDEEVILGFIHEWLGVEQLTQEIVDKPTMKNE